MDLRFQEISDSEAQLPDSRLTFFRLHFPTQKSRELLCNSRRKATALKTYG